MRSVIWIALALIASSGATVKRASTDTCANLVNTRLSVNIPSVGSVTIGLINVCLCQSGISNFEASNIVAQAAIAVAGQPATTSSLTSLISQSGHLCEYPDLAVPVCSASNPCGFSCSNGFSNENGSCVCGAPASVCNGVCQTGPCSTAGMRKRDLPRSSRCPEGSIACGVAGQHGTSAYECVDPESDVESCGGCRVPLPSHLLGPGEHHAPHGHDCTSILAAQKGICDEGVCQVLQCEPGWTRSKSHKACIKAGHLAPLKVHNNNHKSPWRS